MDWPMLYTGNPVVLAPGMVFFMHMILMDSENELAMNLGETYLITPSGNERLGKKTRSGYRLAFSLFSKCLNGA